MNFLPIRFTFRMGFQGFFYAEAMLWRDKVESLTLRPIKPDTFELGAVIDADVWPEFYDEANSEIFRMTRDLVKVRRYYKKDTKEPVSLEALSLYNDIDLPRDEAINE